MGSCCQGEGNPLAGIPTRWSAMMAGLEALFDRLAVANLHEAIGYRQISPEHLETFVKKLTWLEFKTDEAGREWMRCPRCLDLMRVNKQDVIDRLINQTQVTLCKACGPWTVPPRGFRLTPRQQLKRGRTDGG